MTRRSLSFLFVVAVLMSGCAALQPPDAGGPGAGGPPYPAVWIEQPQSREAAVLALNRIVHTNSRLDATTVHLQPLTATINSLPPNLATPLHLPKVGGGATMTEEETREALRRFINDWRELIGANPEQLSLVDRVDRSDGTKVATYEQRIFRYPLRGDFGKLEIQFTSDRRLINVSSSCIRDADRLQAALSNITPRVKMEDALKRVRSEVLAYTDSAGTQQTYNLATNNEANATELVTYAVVSKSQPASLELHVAWEIAVTNAPFKNVYVDAFEDEIIAVR